MCVCLCPCVTVCVCVCVCVCVQKIMEDYANSYLSPSLFALCICISLISKYHPSPTRVASLRHCTAILNTLYGSLVAQEN